MVGLVDASGKPIGEGPPSDKGMFKDEEDRAFWFIEQFGARMVTFLNNARAQGIPVPRVIQFIVDGHESVIATDASAQKAVEEQLKQREAEKAAAKIAAAKAAKTKEDFPDGFPEEGQMKFSGEEPDRGGSV